MGKNDKSATPGSCPGTGSTHNFDVAGRELSVLGCWDCDAQWRLVPYHQVPPSVEPSTDTAPVPEHVIFDVACSVDPVDPEECAKQVAFRVAVSAAYRHGLAARDAELAKLRAIVADEDAVREDIYNALMQPLGNRLDGCGYTGHDKTVYTAGVMSGLLHASKVAIANDQRWLELVKQRGSHATDGGAL